MSINRTPSPPLAKPSDRRLSAYPGSDAFGTAQQFNVAEHHLAAGVRSLARPERGVGRQVSYFLGALGELVQRMNDPNARYALALPDHPQYRGLVNRLPSLARTRLNLEVFFVDVNGVVTTG